MRVTAEWQGDEIVMTLGEPMLQTVTFRPRASRVRLYRKHGLARLVEWTEKAAPIYNCNWHDWRDFGAPSELHELSKELFEKYGF